jgi:pimeloyl-ACP methyl ester carboxylesterase
VQGALRTTSGWIYSSIRGVTAVVGAGLDVALAQLQPELEKVPSSAQRAALLSILNGVLGEHLQDTHNPLTITMGWYHAGLPLEPTTPALQRAFPNANGKLLIALHGHCMNELQWSRNGHNHVQALAQAGGCTAVLVRYNTGLHISTNGQSLAQCVEQLVSDWPVPVSEVHILGFSMGGLLARSAYHYGTQARHRWPELVQKMLFVGTPHQGSMVERTGNWVDVALQVSPYSRALARLGKIRSAGTTDLRFGNLHDQDWHGLDRFAPGADPRQPLPLPAQVQCYAIAGMVTKARGALADQWVGDGLVTVTSALGIHADDRHSLHIPAQHQCVIEQTSHLGLLESQAVFTQLRQWMGADDASSRADSAQGLSSLTPTTK